MKLHIIQPKIDIQHMDSFWYEGDIASIENGDWNYVLQANGDIKIYFLDDTDGNWYCDNNAVEEANCRNYTDKDLCEEKICFENNNWYEIVGYNKKTGETESIMGDVSYDYNEGIHFLWKYAIENVFDDKGGEKK